MVKMLKVLEGTLLDLGPEFWAVIVLVALVVVELFDLGPHTFSNITRSRGKDKKKSHHKLHPTSMIGRGGVRKRHHHDSIDPREFGTIIDNFHIREKDALLYLGKGGDDLELRPTPRPDSASEGISPQMCELDNYVIARGQSTVPGESGEFTKEDAKVTILRQVVSLWSAKGGTNARYLVLYSPRPPSTYAVQCIADVLKGYSARVGVSVLYLEEDEDGDEVGNLEERREHLDKAGITLEKIKY